MFHCYIVGLKYIFQLKSPSYSVFILMLLFGFYVASFLPDAKNTRFNQDIAHLDIMAATCTQWENIRVRQRSVGDEMVISPGVVGFKKKTSGSQLLTTHWRSASRKRAYVPGWDGSSDWPPEANGATPCVCQGDGHQGSRAEGAGPEERQETCG